MKWGSTNDYLKFVGLIVTNEEVLWSIGHDKKWLIIVKLTKTAYLDHIFAMTKLSFTIMQRRIEEKKGTGRKNMSWLIDWEISESRLIAFGKVIANLYSGRRQEKWLNKITDLLKLKKRKKYMYNYQQYEQEVCNHSNQVFLKY